MKPDFEKLRPYVRHIRLEDLMEHSAQQLKGATTGRVLVAFGD